MINKKDRIESAIRHIQTATDVDPWAMELAVEALKAQTDGDIISRQAAIDALAKMMPKSYTPDGSHPADEEIFKAQEIFVDCIEAIKILPSAQPKIVQCKDCKFCHKSPDWKHRQSFGESIWYCEKGRGLNLAEAIELDDYCSSAERRSNG